MKYWLIICATLLCTTAGWAQDRVKIGFIDIQRAISESQAGKRAKEQFQVQVKKAQSDLLREKQDLERLKSDLDKKGPLLREEERLNLQSDAYNNMVPPGII